MESNEKLEFLGDSIVEFISSEYLYQNYKNLKEGEMTKVRASVVCEESLSKLAKSHDFSDFLYLGKSEIANKGAFRKAVLEGDVDMGSVMAGQVCGQLTEIRPIADILENMYTDAQKKLEEMGRRTI